MKKTIIILLLALGVVSGVKAQTPTIPDDAYGREIIEIININMADGNLAEILYDTMNASLGDKIADAKLRPMCDELAQVLTPMVYYSAYKAYVEIFTLDELKEIHKFYETPTGLKLARNLSKINAVTTEVMSSPETQQLIMPIIMKYIQ